MTDDMALEIKRKVFSSVIIVGCKLSLLRSRVSANHDNEIKFAANFYPGVFIIIKSLSNRQQLTNVKDNALIKT